MNTSKDSLGAGCALHHGDNLSLFELNRLLELKQKVLEKMSLPLSYDTYPRERSKASHSCLGVHNSGQVTEFLNFFLTKLLFQV